MFLVTECQNEAMESGDQSQNPNFDILKSENEDLQQRVSGKKYFSFPFHKMINFYLLSCQRLLRGIGNSNNIPTN